MTNGGRSVDYDLGASLITTSEAAELAGVAVSTIRVWVHRGTLAVAHRQDRKALFRPLDVLDAEHTNRRADPAKKRQHREAS